MTEVLFYHLERARLESVLPGLLEKTLERGWRAVVRCGARETVERLDEILWTYSEESFLPHGREGGDQPIMLTADPDAVHGADLLFLVDGAAVEASALAPFARCVAIFDGSDEAAVAAARRFWTDVKAAGCDATYWKQSREGRWEKQG